MRWSCKQIHLLLLSALKYNVEQCEPEYLHVCLISNINTSGATRGAWGVRPPVPEKSKREQKQKNTKKNKEQTKKKESNDFCATDAI